MKENDYGKNIAPPGRTSGGRISINGTENGVTAAAGLSKAAMLAEPVLHEKERETGAPFFVKNDGPDAEARPAGPFLSENGHIIVPAYRGLKAKRPVVPASGDAARDALARGRAVGGQLWPEVFRNAWMIYYTKADYNVIRGGLAGMLRSGYGADDETGLRHKMWLTRELYESSLDEVVIHYLKCAELLTAIAEQEGFLLPGGAGSRLTDNDGAFYGSLTEVVFLLLAENAVFEPAGDGRGGARG